MTDPALTAATDDIQSLIARADSKASMLLAGTAATVAIIAGATDAELPAAVQVVGALALAALLTAGGLLLAVVYPRTAGLAEHHLAAYQDADVQEARYRVLATACLRKFTMIQRAVYALCVSGSLLAAAAALNSV